MKINTRNTVQHRFNKAANHYVDYAVVQQRMEQELVERLSFFTLKPKIIVDLGCGIGSLSQPLQQQYPDSHIINVDCSINMLTQHRSGQNVQPLLGDAHLLPLADNSVDMIISNAMLMWSTNIIELFTECKRVLIDDGLFIFTTLGPATLHEWQLAWQQSMSQASMPKAHTNYFIDMHDIADLLMQVGFSHPVMDRDAMHINYRSIDTLTNDLKGMGSTLIHPKKNTGLTTQQHWQRMHENYPRLDDGSYPSTWEIIHGHCFNAPPKAPKHQQPFEIPLSSLKSQI